ncbi:MAG TPA: amidohydrolase family protein, partial [Brevibacterium sp.]|nr:amidohydrolase family protein [Brevibacterium sp.]
FLSDDGQIFRAFQKGADNGALMMMHAENGSVIDVLVEQALERGETGPINHGLTRPWQMEEEATHRAIKIADVAGCPLYFVHVTAKQAAMQIAEARGRGANVFGETCPQYLYLSLEDQLGAHSAEWGEFEGAKWVASPPLRSKHEGHREFLWKALRMDELQMVSTDHCPFCMKDQKELGANDFSKIPNGFGTVEHRLDLLYQGVVDEKIGLERFVEITSTTPARMFGLYGRKGVIQPGADGDVVVYDPDGRTTISADTAHMALDYSAWEGFEIDGKVDTVLSRGKVIVHGDTYLGRKGDGQYLKRGTSQYLI